MFTPHEMNHTKREKELEFDLNGLKPVGVKTPSVNESSYELPVQSKNSNNQFKTERGAFLCQ